MSVLVHYETLLRLSNLLIKNLRIHSQVQVGYGIVGALIAHVTEV
jgi:hypothetical protein